MKTRFQLIFNAFIFIAVVALYALYFWRSQEKIAYVDSTKLLNGYQAMIRARQDYQAKARLWQANIDTLLSGVQTSIKQYEKESATMSARERALSQELIGSKQKQLADYQRAIQEKARQEDSRLTGKVLKQANAFLERYGKEKHYQIIFAANPSGNIAYAKEYLDITGPVLEVMNQEYGHGPATALAQPAATAKK